MSRLTRGGGGKHRSAAGRNPWQQPFASTDFWNIGVGSNATWETTGDTNTAHLIGLAGAINTNGNFNQPYYLGHSTDPLITVTCSDTLDPLISQTIRIPLGATPAGGSDKHMTFFDKTQPSFMWNYFNCVISNAVSGGIGASSSIAASLGGVFDVSGSGVYPYGDTFFPGANATSWTDNGAGNAGNNNYGIGAIRDWEITAGVIKHALRYALGANDTHWGTTGPAWQSSHAYIIGQHVINGGNPYGCITAGTSAGSGGPTGTTRGTNITDGTAHWTYTGPTGFWTCNVPWPNAHTDYCGGPTTATFCGSQDYTGIIPFGQTLGIPAATVLTGRGLSAPGLMLATCIQTYGMVQRDTGGSSNVILYTENVSGGNQSKVTSMASDFNSIIVPLLRVMTNQSVDGVNNINGGGTYPTLLPPVDTSLIP